METISQITNAGKSYCCETSMFSAYKRILVFMQFILITYSLFILYKLHFLKFLLCIMYICISADSSTLSLLMLFLLARNMCL